MRKELTNDEIISMYELQDVINSNFKQNKEYGFDLDVDSFFLRCRNLKTQIYGLRVQAYLCTLLKYKTTPSSDDCGDFKTRENQDVEFKCSFIDSYARAINVKQIRNWQDLDYYYCFTVDYSDYRNIIYKCYKLTKAQMEEECITVNAKPVHSTKKNNENNEKVELGFSIKIGSEHFDRWETRYLNKKLDLKFLSNERITEIQTKNAYESEIEKYKAEIERLKSEISDKRLKEEIKTDEIIEEVVENILNSEVDIVSLPSEDNFQPLKKSFLPKVSLTLNTDFDNYNKDKADRIEAIKLIPQEWIEKLFVKAKNQAHPQEFMYEVVSWKIKDMKEKAIKRRPKALVTSLTATEILNMQGKGTISQEEATELLKVRMNEIHNSSKGKIEYDILDCVEDEFVTKTIDDSEYFNQLRTSSAYY